MNCSCTPSAIAAPTLTGIEVVALAAAPVKDYPVSEIEIPNHGVFPPGTIDFCNVTITYTQPGHDGEINVEAWLPPQDIWNERILAVGGGGLVTGRSVEQYNHMVGVVSEKYATITTDAGVPNGNVPAEWVLKEPGVLNEDVVAYWGTASLDDMARIGKSLVESFYKQPAEYSYFVGCSQGGRQGYELAQSYPDAFDGIAAAAPALRLAEILMNWYWPQIQMNLKGEWPRGCEIDSLSSLAIKKCDGKDGVEDGIISDPYACDAFDPFDEVGSPADECADPSSGISEMAAYVTNATWAGIWDEQGQPIFFAPHPGTDLTGIKTGAGIAATTCQDEGQECAGAPLPLGPWWISFFAMKDPDFDYENLTLEQFYDILRDSRDEYAPYVGSDNPDLSAFRQRGGKMITYHGLADQTIPADLTRDYYERVTALDPNASDFFRYFEVPALGHCLGNGHPTSTFNALRDWVEDGVAPDTLPSSPKDAAGNLNDRVVCAYPQVAQFLPECGDASVPECFACQ